MRKLLYLLLIAALGFTACTEHQDQSSAEATKEEIAEASKEVNAAMEKAMARKRYTQRKVDRNRSGTVISRTVCRAVDFHPVTG